MEQAFRLKELAGDMSVLYVEDEKAVREETAEFLKKFFLTVDTAKNGKEGVELFERHRHDVVITDIVMPVMEGEDMMVEMRAIDPNIPIVIISAYDFSDFLVPKFPKGANAFIKKPATYTDLVKTLCDLIATVKQKDDTVSVLKKHINTLEEKIEVLEEKLSKLESKV